MAVYFEIRSAAAARACTRAWEAARLTPGGRNDVAQAAASGMLDMNGRRPFSERAATVHTTAGCHEITAAKW